MDQTQEPHVIPKSADHSRDLVVYASKQKARIWSFVGVALTIIVVVGALLPPTTVSAFGYAPALRISVLVLGLALFGSVTVRMLLLLFVSTPVLIVTDEGIWVNSFIFGTSILLWSEIESLLVDRYRKPERATLEIILIDRHSISARQNALQRLVYLLLGYPLVWPRAVVVNDFMLQISASVLLNEIQNRYQKKLTQYGIQMKGFA